LTRGNALRKEETRLQKGRDQGYEFGRAPSKAEQQVLDRAEISATAKKSGSELWPENIQIRRAKERAQSIVDNLKSEYKSRPYTDDKGLLKEGTAYFLTPAQEKKIKELLYPIKLREIKEGTPRLDIQTIAHRSPDKGVWERGRMNTEFSGGENVSRGMTTWANITDDLGNLNLVSLRENIKAGNIIPDEFKALVPSAGVLAGNTADASILSSRFTPKELQERKDLAASRRQWVGEKLHYLNPVLNSLTGPFSKGTPNMKPWQKKMKDPTWGGGLLR